MEKDKKTSVTIDDKEYFFEDLTDEQKAHVNHIADLDRKIKTAEFNIEQLRFGREAFVVNIKKLLETED